MRWLQIKTLREKENIFFSLAYHVVWMTYWFFSSMTTTSIQFLIFYRSLQSLLELPYWIINMTLKREIINRKMIYCYIHAWAVKLLIETVDLSLIALTWHQIFFLPITLFWFYSLKNPVEFSLQGLLGLHNPLKEYYLEDLIWNLAVEKKRYGMDLRSWHPSYLASVQMKCNALILPLDEEENTLLFSIKRVMNQPYDPDFRRQFVMDLIQLMIFLLGRCWSMGFPSLYVLIKIFETMISEGSKVIVDYSIELTT